MAFLTPLYLLLFIPIGAVIILLYLLKLKRREHVVSSVMLWRDAVADIQANSLFQKLKKNLLLLLQLAALLFLIGCLARPFMRLPGLAENRIAVIIDSSASMKATDVSPTRFDNAKSRALDIASKLGPGDTMLLMSAGPKARVITRFTSDKKALRKAIASLQCADAPCDMRQALVLALSLVGGKSGTPARTVVLSDGAFGSLTDLAPSNANLEFMRIGRRCENVGITTLATRKSASGEQQVFVGLQNFGKREKKFNLEVYLNDELVDIQPQKIAAATAAQHLLRDMNAVSGRVTVKLALKDDLPVDNTAYVYLAGQRKIGVLLVSRGNIFLENAINLDPRTSLTKAEAFPAGLRSGQYDLVVCDGVKPPTSLPSGSYLLINTAAAQGPADEGVMINIPVIIDSSRSHPVFSYVDFSDVRLKQAHSLVPKAWAETVVEASEGPLAVVGSNEGRSFVQLSWDVLESNFPLHIGFPIFIANCMDWLAPPERSGHGQTARTGETVYLDVPTSVSKITVSSPAGSESVNVAQTPVPFDNAETVGVYKASGPGFSKEFACNLASSRESDITPVDKLRMSGKAFSGSSRKPITNQEYYWPLALLVLCVLAFEWHVYHRRI